ncbi:MAG TPA: LapA family protein [Acidimicrobiales bacterium]
MAQAPERSGGPSDAKSDKRDKRDNREIIRLVVFGLALVLLVAFIIGNSKDVKVNFVFFHTSTSLIWVILVSAVLGVLVDRLVIALGKRRKKGK